jgi:hypothetical protein
VIRVTDVDISMDDLVRTEAHSPLPPFDFEVSLFAHYVPIKHTSFIVLSVLNKMVLAFRRWTLPVWASP